MAFLNFNFPLDETSRGYLRRAKSPPNRELKPSSPRSGSGEAVWGRFLFWSEIWPAVAVAFCSAAAGFSVEVAGAAYWSLLTVEELAAELVEGVVACSEVAVVLGVVATA